MITRDRQILDYAAQGYVGALACGADLALGLAAGRGLR